MLSKILKAAVVVPVVGLLTQAQAQAQPAPMEITIAVSSTSFPLGSLRLADKMGFFEKHGVKARFIVSDTGAAAMAALVSGSVNFVSTGLEELLALRNQNHEETALVANVYRGLSAVVVLRKDVADKLALKPNSTPQERAKALDGITLAAPSPSSSILGGVRMAVNLAGAKINLAYMQQPVMFAALEKNAIQAYVASSPYWERAVESGAAVRWLSGPDNEFPDDAVTVSASALQTSRAFAQRNPEAIRAVRAGFQDVANAVRERPADLIKALKELYPDLAPSVVEAAFKQNSPAWLNPEFTEADVRREIAIRAKTGDMKNIEKINVSTMIIPK